MADTSPIGDDPCTYKGQRTKKREIHANLKTNAVRIYERDGNGYTILFEEDGLIDGPVTTELARSCGWCNMYPVVTKAAGPTSKQKLINFVIFCSRREIGFHSDHWKKSGSKSKIPGSQSHGCIRVPDADSSRFFNLVRIGDCVRLYSRSDWREPTFRPCSVHAHCTKKGG